MRTRITTHPLATTDRAAISVPSDQALARRLRRSFDVLVPMADDIATRFYDALFVAHPPLRAMFPPDLAKQRKILMQTLEWIVIHMTERDKLDTAITALGQRHAGYGARSHHYKPVIEHLVQSMAEMAADRWTSEDRTDWHAALSLIADRMIAADPSVRADR